VDRGLKIGIGEEEFNAKTPRRRDAKVTSRKIGELIAWDDQNEPQRVVGFTTF
jgi:hypothetical protein